MNLDLIPVACPNCSRMWEFPGPDRLVELLTEIARHIRDEHVDEELALRVERLAISSGREMA